MAKSDGRTVNVGGRHVREIRFSPDGRWLAGCGGEFGEGGWVLLWEAPFGRTPRVLELPGKMVSAIEFAPDGAHLACGNWADSEVQFRAIPSLEAAFVVRLMAPDAKPVIKGEPPSAVVDQFAFSPDGGTLAAGCWDLRAKLWDVRSRRLRELTPKHPDTVKFVAFVERGRRLVSGTNHTLWVWDVASGKRVKTIRLPGGKNAWVHALSPDGQSLLSVGRRGTLRTFDTVTWKHVETPIKWPSEVRSVALAPDGRTIAVGLSNGTLALVDHRTGRRQWCDLEGKGGIMALAHSPDGASLAYSQLDESQRSALRLIPVKPAGPR